MVAVRDRQRRRPKRHLRLRRLAQDAYRRSSVTDITNSVNGIDVETFSYAYDALNRPTSRNADTFGYNDRSEVTSATIGGNYETHEYDSIGNSIIASMNGTTNTYSANNLNQYISILRASARTNIRPRRQHAFRRRPVVHLRCRQ